MDFLHRQEIVNTLQSLQYGERTIFAWGCEVAEPDFEMPTSFVFNSGEVVQIPVSKKDLKMVEEKAERIPIGNWQIEWRIQGKDISLLPLNFPAFQFKKLVEFSLNHLRDSQLDGASVEANLSHMSLYRPVEAADDVEYEGNPDPNRSLRVKPDGYMGSFATFILQIPVVGGFKGGEFRLHSRNLLSEAFSTSKNSQRAFYSTVYYDNCQETMEPLTKGCRLELVYSLSWTTLSEGSVSKPFVDDVKSPLYRIWQDSVSNQELNPAVLTPKQKKFQQLFDCWKEPKFQRVELYIIPLDHGYSPASLSFDSLIGIDRSTVQSVTSLLGDVAEIHLATVTKYVGYKDEDWITSGKEFVMKKTGKRLEVVRETDLTEYWAGHFVDRLNRPLSLPPLSISLPEEFLGSEDQAFRCQPPGLDSSGGGVCGGYSFDRAAVVIWPLNKTFSTALCFGLDQALDVVESSLEEEIQRPWRILETAETQMSLLLAYCKRDPTKVWYAGTAKCNDLRCEGSRPVSIPVASQRSIRLIQLCLRLNMSERGLDLLKLLFTPVEHPAGIYRCHRCHSSSFHHRSVFVGGISSGQAADALAKLIAMLDWDYPDVQSCVRSISNQQIHDTKQMGHFAQLVVSLFHVKSFEAATYFSQRVYEILMDLYLKDPVESRINDGALGSCVAMLLLIDGLPFSDESRLNHVLERLKMLNSGHPSVVMSWMQHTDAALLKSLPTYWHFYMELVGNLENQLVVVVADSPSASRMPYVSRLEKAAAQLMTSYLRLDDKVMLKTLIDKLSGAKSAESRNLLSALITSRWMWAVPSTPLIDNTLASLCKIRYQQLVHFRYPRFKWEQPDALLKDHPLVEEFMRSAEPTMTYGSFANQEEIDGFRCKYFGDVLTVSSGYSAAVTATGRNEDGTVHVVISKTEEIYESALKQLHMLDAILTCPVDVSTPESSTADVGSAPTSPELNTVKNKLSAKRPRRSLETLIPAKRSKRISLANQKTDPNHSD